MRVISVVTLICAIMVHSATAWICKTNYLKVESSNIIKLTKLLGVFIVVDLCFFGCDLSTDGFPGGHGIAPFFWFEIIGCAIAAVICFTNKFRTNKLIVFASIISILGIFCKRVQLLVGGFQLPNIDPTMQLPANSVIGWENGVALVNHQMIYWPSLLEFGITVGVLALGGLLLLFGLKYLPLK